MANLITSKAYVGTNVSVRRTGFGPTVQTTIDATEKDVTANEVLAILKIPETGVPRTLMIDVKEAATGTCTIKVGKHVAGDTTVDSFNSGSSVDLTAAGRTIYALGSNILAGADDYIVIKAEHAIKAAVVTFTMSLDIMEPTAEDYE